jgi:hypothetical protein
MLHRKFGEDGGHSRNTDLATDFHGLTQMEERPPCHPDSKGSIRRAERIHPILWFESVLICVHLWRKS